MHVYVLFKLHPEAVQSFCLHFACARPFYNVITSWRAPGCFARGYICRHGNEGKPIDFRFQGAGAEMARLGEKELGRTRIQDGLPPLPMRGTYSIKGS